MLRFPITRALAISSTTLTPTVTLKKLLSLRSDEHDKGVDMLEQLLASMEFAILEQINQEDFIAGLRRCLFNRPEGSAAGARLVGLIDKYGLRLDTDGISDLLPGLTTLRAELVAKRLIVDQPSHLADPPEGQDPDEFLAEVAGTLRLFDEIAQRAEKQPQDTRDTLITLATNLDRYQEQLEIWQNMLEGYDAHYTTQAAELMDKVTRALDRYRTLRI